MNILSPLLLFVYNSIKTNLNKRYLHVVHIHTDKYLHMYKKIAVILLARNGIDLEIIHLNDKLNSDQMLQCECFNRYRVSDWHSYTLLCSLDSINIFFVVFTPVSRLRVHVIKSFHGEYIIIHTSPSNTTSDKFYELIFMHNDIHFSHLPPFMHIVFINSKSRYNYL